MSYQSLALSSFVAAFAGSCDVPDPGEGSETDAIEGDIEPSGGAGGKADSPDDPVALRYANLYNGGLNWVAVIETRQGFFEEHVSVRYQDAAGQWVEREGNFLRSLSAGHDLWFVDGLPAVEPLNFAVHYRVVTSGGLGSDFWDNNGGANYSATTLSAPLGPDVDIAVVDVGAQVLSGGSGYILLAEMLVRNAALEKSVKVVYTFDGWATPLSAPAEFHEGGEQGGERWRLGVVFPAFATDLEFAAMVEQDGRNAWDNDFGDNFACHRDANGTNWTCAGAGLLQCSASGCVAKP
jgi:hypothetical protein